MLANTDNSVDGLVELSQETYLCPSTAAYITPLRAVNTAGKWRIVVNGVKAHYETLTQTARVEQVGQLLNTMLSSTSESVNCHQFPLSRSAPPRARRAPWCRLAT